MRSYKYNVISAKYDEETGKSYVNINTDIGVFTGCAKCHSDEERPSKMFGCQIAEGRALDKYLCELVKIAKARQKELQHLYNAFASFSKYEIENYYTSKARHAIYNITEEIEDIECKRVQLHNRIKTMCIERDTLLSSHIFNKESKK